ncbi:GntR family transcriptional regulator [Bradyrhizobium sp. U87765 SZCCT0131]|uniref:GntR family transcriptional regulator n=1 Tax=unclassified Bradyrhizobium TaxID=2631580 RepID=UPI001BA59C68|nr:MULTISPECIES: GntR family transcriptional regulator [unclassified Bradyrhizobium]MBR1217941.1 GntR family transcriptional regulator [Bradyrhizobium sp. U87765 SZCCT0131]MBR1261113.1 GntR family transcriptional regulator [Bradyrhizobium sp. U87765 SZCCT0134]MBR1303439.1 GntR family transcriptional regulator [Bradyrhizobium sp. U87765 SZCCT0110]MBR1319045.1 GntR family transcriptional regulator [Bradyrhizobium sp. U87765 SZCCT0109]MBR1347370.1 GntR family transcriptional regulator [Bradyrhizo
MKRAPLHHVAGTAASGAARRAATPDFRPLYRQVKETLIRRIAEGRWTPDKAIPNEFELAADLGVSQGTVRKALDEMAGENLLVRYQGRGTFVAAHDEPRILFQFFKLTPDHGARVYPESRVLGTSEIKAPRATAAALALPPEARVIRIRRLRSLAGRPAIVETILLPATRFTRLTGSPIPNNLYQLYATRFGARIARAEERLKAVALSATDAGALGSPPRTPALLIDRTAFDLEGRAVEHRLSVCLTEATHYLSDLR